MSTLTDAEKLSQPMGQFEAWFGKLFAHWGNERLGFRYLRDLPGALTYEQLCDRVKV
jgi:hypothetical protein